MSIRGILFDLDGTLINTNELIVETFQYTYKKILQLDVPREEITQYFGEPLVDTLAKYDSEKVDLLLKTYRDYNYLKHDELATIFPGVKDTIRTLKENGYKLAVVTSKKNEGARKGLSLFGLTPYIDYLVGYDDTKKHKPNPDPALRALQALKLNPEETLMVGDSPYDILCGKTAGTYTGIVKYSEHSLEKLMELKPDYVLNQLPDLLKILS
ncbi:MAG: pyrophosphatase PpaX [Clostridia bacterium]|jgi:pyrophosphatase PpaX|nr:pyrophosphatase PpaX [Clostridia bacterium]MDN5323768.1 pyrophosphatase PpaX [Clostridia bacterium]